MTRFFTAHTEEIDDIQAAVDEIIGALPRPDELLAHTFGFISCFADFVETGVVKLLCSRLPFEIIGITTLGNAADGVFSETMLTLSLITSDDVSFSTVLTDPISSEDALPLRNAYDIAAAKATGPVFMLSAVPLLLNVGGDFFVNTMNEITGGLPNFGTVAVDHNPTYNQAGVIYNGEFYRDRYAFSLICGDIEPVFFVSGVSNERVFSEKGVITGSNGNQLLSVNGMSALDFCKSLGLSQNDDGTIAGINLFPLIVDRNDGTPPVIRSMFATTPEGYAVCGGDMPVGATVSVGAFDSNEILTTSAAAVAKALGHCKNGMIIFSCVGRYFSQGFAATAEMELVCKMTQGKPPFQLSYSGGELCPVYGADGKLVNRSHNDTIAICVF